jgi:hypothetical protein
MKRHEFEAECLQMILNKNSDDFVDQMTNGDLRENMIEFFNVWATHRHNPEALSSHLSRFIAGMIAYEAKHSRYVNDEPTAEDIWNYHQDMKTMQWENRHDF